MASTADDHGAVLVRAAEAEALESDPGSVITLLADTDITGGLLTSNRSLLRDGSDGAPPHYHERSAELFFMLGGALQVLLGDQVVTLQQGDLLVVPPGLPHAFAPAPGSDADVLFVFTPGTARFDYYRLSTPARPPCRRSPRRRSASTTTTSRARPGVVPVAPAVERDEQPRQAAALRRGGVDAEVERDQRGLGVGQPVHQRGEVR